MFSKNNRCAWFMWIAASTCLAAGCGDGDRLDGVGESWSLEQGGKEEVAQAPEPAAPVMETRHGDQVEPAPVEVIEPVELLPLTPKQTGDACDRGAVAHDIAVSNKQGLVCLQEVYGDSGCLSTQLRFYHDALGRVVREDSAIHDFEFQLAACGPYTDIPSPYRKEWRYDGESGRVLEETRANAPDAEEDTGRVAYDWDGEHLTGRYNEFLGEDGAWEVQDWEAWEFGEGGMLTSWYRGWGEGAGYGEHYKRDAQGRILEQEQSNGTGQRWLSRRQVWGEDAEIPIEEEDYGVDGEKNRHLKRTIEQQEREDGKLWEVAIEEVWTSAATYFNETARHIDGEVEVSVMTNWMERPDGRTQIFSKTRHTFDGEESLFERYDLEKEQWVRYERERYDERGDVLETQRWSAAGQVREHIFFEYDARGRKVAEFQDYDQDGNHDLCSAWVYDARGNLAQESVDVSCDGQVENVQQHTYDALDRLVTTVADWDGDGQIDQRYEQRFGCEF